jgi:EAL domain-containing protein (putative c-di-GMP-specific phosphodiesterase class I)
LKPVSAPAPAAAVDLPAASVESLGQALREALPVRRLHSLSLCDHEANVLWLSEGALGPDEHNLVTEALHVLSTDTTLPTHEIGLEDGRLALFLAVRAPTADLVGIGMILADSKSVGDDTLERLVSPPVRAIMLRLAVLMKPNPKTAALPARDLSPLEAATAEELALAAPEGADAPADEVMSPEQTNDILQFELSAAESAPREIPRVQPAMEMDLIDLDLSADTTPARPAPPPPAAPRRPVAAVPAAAPPVAPPTLARVVPPPQAARPAAPVRPVAAPAPPVAPPAAAAVAAPAPATAPAAPATPAAVNASDPNLLLEVLAFAKLRPGGQTRRFQVLTRSGSGQRDPSAHDALVLQRLLAWLAAHRASWNSQPTGFTVNLSIATLEDERFVQKVATALNSHGIAGETLGFEIAEALCTQRRAQVERFITQCDKVGSWVVIDDFSFDSQVLPMLRSKAVRLVKMDAKLSSAALKDKLSQALVVATVQAAKVLGIHCAAKKVDSQAALQWLTAIGCDFAQGAALAGVQTLDSLAGSPDPTGVTALLRPT